MTQLVELAPLLHEVVVLHAVPAVPGRGVALRQAAVDEGIVLRLYHLRHTGQKLKLAREHVAQRLVICVYVEVLVHRHSGGVAHLLQKPRAVAVGIGQQIVPDVPVPAGLGVVALVVPVVAVAQDEPAAPALVQIHEEVQRIQALRPLFHDVAAEDQRVLAAEVELVQQSAQVFKIAVDVGDGDYPPRVRQRPALDAGLHQHYSSRSIRIWSLATPGSMRMSRKP